MFKPFHDVLANVSQTIEDHSKNLGRPVIGVMPAYFPMEIIWAAGGYPVQLWGNRMMPAKADAYLQSYCCSVARSALELELGGGSDMVKAYVFTSLCDTLINLREIYRRIFEKPTLELSIPVTGTAAARREYLTAVVESVTHGLEEITEQEISIDALTEAAALYGRTRALQRRLYEIRLQNPGGIPNYDFYAAVKAGFFLPVTDYHDLLADLLAALAPAVGPSDEIPKLVLSGMVFDPMEVYKKYDELGVAVVDDDFANGWRTAAKIDLKVDNLIESVTDYLFNPAPCCCIYSPDSDRHSYLVEKVRAAAADGVIFWYVKFCEPDAFDLPQLMQRLKKEGIPATTIECELSMRNFQAVKTRIEAFCEMIKT